MAIISQSNNQAMRNPWVLGALGFVVLVLLVNIAFIVTAISTNPGLVDQNYYEKGRHFEDSIQQRREMVNRLNWDLRIQVPEEMVMGQTTAIYVHAIDSAGMPLQDATAVLHAYRPSDANADFEIAMSPYAAGIFMAEAAFHLQGIWDLKVRVSQGEDHIETRRRISVKTN